METQRLNGGTVLESGSRLAQQSVGRVALMYKSYGVRMYVTMLKSSVLALMNAKNISQQEKRVYIKEIIGVHLSALALSGVYGTPIYGLVKILLNLFYDDDELDADSRVREYLGEGWFKGGPTAALNLDISSRIRLNSLIIQENRFAGSMSVEEQLFFHFGGPGFSTVKSILRGGQDFIDGELLRGLENVTPTAIRNFGIKSLRVFTEGGYYTRRGDPIYDDVTSLDMAGIMLGLAPAKYSEASQKAHVRKNIDKKLSERKRKLTSAYYQAYRDLNFADQIDILKKIREFNKRYAKFPDLQITSETIERSVRQQERTTKKMKKYNGISIQNESYIDSLGLMTD